MQNICFIADVAVLFRWIRVYQLLNFVESVHSRFSRKRAEDLLSRTKISAKSKVRQLSKGMVTQLHLSIITAIDAKLLVLAVMPVVPMRRKFTPLYRKLKIVEPIATAPRYTALSRWPVTAVSTMPSNGTEIFERISGAAMRQTSRFCGIDNSGRATIIAKRRSLP